MKKTCFVAALFLLVFSSFSPGAVFPQYPDLEIFGQKFFADFSRSARPSDFLVSDDYVLGSGDELVVNVWGFIEDEYRKEIESDGSIFISRIGKLYVGGKRLGEAKKFIGQEFDSKYKNVTISITTGKLRTIPVFVLGEVKKPGSYDVAPVFDVLDALALAGGPGERGSLRKIKIVRKNGEQFVVDLYPFLLEGKRPPSVQFMPGDSVFVPLAGALAGIRGPVRRPAVYEITENTTLEDLAGLAGGYLPTADTSRIQIECKDSEQGVVLTDRTLQESAGYRMASYDVVTVFPAADEKYLMVSLEGAVRQPGRYGWRKGMKAGDILTERALLAEAFRDKAEIVRTREDGSRTVLSFSPKALFAGDAGQNPDLLPLDKVLVAAQARPEKKVWLQGEVAFPGEYIFGAGERLSSVIERAGGFSPYAYLPGAAFFRESVRIQKERQLRQFVAEKSKTLEQEGERSDREEQQLIDRGKTLLKQLSESEVKGRIVIKLETPDKFRGGASDIMLEDGDILVVPKQPISVALLGEISQTTNILYDEKYTFNDYIQRAGGYTRDADRNNVFIVRVDGTATRDIKSAVGRGDTILVPFEAKERTGKIIRDIIQMIYQVSLSIATFY